jgi:hypothetical protein
MNQNTPYSHRPAMRRKLACAAAYHLRVTVENLVALKKEIETHKAQNRKRVLSDQDAEFYSAVEKAQESLLEARRRVSILYDYWSKEK